MINALLTFRRPPPSPPPPFSLLPHFRLSVRLSPPLVARAARSEARRGPRRQPTIDRVHRGTPAV